MTSDDGQAARREDPGSELGRTFDLVTIRLPVALTFAGLLGGLTLGVGLAQVGTGGVAGR